MGRGYYALYFRHKETKAQSGGAGQPGLHRWVTGRAGHTGTAPVAAHSPFLEAKSSMSLPVPGQSWPPIPAHPEVVTVGGDLASSWAALPLDSLPRMWGPTAQGTVPTGWGLPWVPGG